MSKHFFKPENAFYIQPSANKRVMGAKKVTFDGITFDSKFECNAYQKFKANKLNFQHQKKILLQPKFKYMGETVRAITWTCDFWFPDQQIIVDAKGFPTEVAKIKIKIMKRRFFASSKEIEILLPKNMKEVIEIIFTKLKNQL